jgi:hypothetical protein
MGARGLRYPSGVTRNRGEPNIAQGPWSVALVFSTLAAVDGMVVRAERGGQIIVEDGLIEGGPTCFESASRSSATMRASYPTCSNWRGGGARPSAIAYSRVGTGTIPSAVPSNSSFPASHSGLERGLIAQSC